MRIPVVFATDENYIFYTAVAISSLAGSAAENTQYDIYILTGEDFPEDSILNEVNRRYINIEIHIINVRTELFRHAVINNGHVTKAAFYRLALCDLLDVEKCIYLDSDIIVTEDLQSLFAVDLTEFPLAGCRDIWIDMLSEEAREKRRVKTGLPSMDSYVNSGVLVMNVKKLRADGYDKRFMEQLEWDHPYEDQDIINICCYGKIRHLPAKWNIFTFFLFQTDEMRKHGIREEVIKELEGRKGIIHYATPFMRPWEHFYCWGNREWWTVAGAWKEQSFYREIKERVRRKEELEEWSCYLKKCQGHDRVVIFGFTSYGRQVCDWLLNAVEGKKLLFCDNSPKKKGMVYRGIGTIPLCEVNLENTLFINSSQNRSAEVTELLIDTGVGEKDIICYRPRKKEYYQYLDHIYYLDELKDIFLRERGKDRTGFVEDLSIMREKLRGGVDYVAWRARYHMKEWILKEG